MEESSQLRAPVALPTWTERPIEVDCAPEPVWTPWSGVKLLPLPGIQPPIVRSYNL
jgi:hypothetical protein